MKRLDISGRRFGRLVAISVVAGSSPLTKWLCQCDCGVIKPIRLAHLRQGRTQSCGCFHREVIAITPLTHGKTKTYEWRIWMLMRQRCNNPKSTPYTWYGGMGIKVCPRWDSFENFLSDMGMAPSTKHSIDRKDSSGNYEPENCRWATKTEQARNKVNTVFAVVNGQKKSLADWCDQFGVPLALAGRRIRRGWTPERALGINPR